MKLRKLLVIPLLAVAALTLSVSAFAQGNVPSYQQLTTISLPGGLASFDISWIDPGTQRYYLADRTATKGTGRIDVIDTRQNTFLYTIPTSPAQIGFAGSTGSGASSGPNGVVAVPQLNQLYVGDGDSTVKVIDLGPNAVVAVIPTGGQFRADELAYDPLDRIIMITNPNDSPPFVTFISVDTQSVLGHYTFPSTQSGLEQPVWNPLTRRFYMSVPTTATTIGGVAVLNPLTMTLEATYLTTVCSPSGLVLTPNQRLMTACGVALDARTGKLIAWSSNATADQVWYNPGDNRYYFGATNAAVVDADTNQFLGYLPGAAGHSLAVDPNNNHIFAPVTGVGIKVFAQVSQ